MSWACASHQYCPSPSGPAGVQVRVAPFVAASGPELTVDVQPASIQSWMVRLPASPSGSEYVAASVGIDVVCRLSTGDEKAAAAKAFGAGWVTCPGVELSYGSNPSVRLEKPPPA